MVGVGEGGKMEFAFAVCFGVCVYGAVVIVRDNLPCWLVIPSFVGLGFFMSVMDSCTMLVETVRFCQLWFHQLGVR
jgi:hypothetical protein